MTVFGAINGLCANDPNWIFFLSKDILLKGSKLCIPKYAISNEKGIRHMVMA